MNNTCHCKGWVTSNPSLQSAQTIAGIHGWQFSGTSFSFCPWCGKSLSKNEEPTKKECPNCQGQGFEDTHGGSTRNCLKCNATGRI